MRVRKGQPNYLFELKRYDMNTCLLEWGITLLALILGYSLFGGIINFISIVAIIGMYIPARDSMEYYKKRHFKPMDSKNEQLLKGINENIHILYNPLLECRSYMLGIEAIVISGSTVLVHVNNPKTNIKFTQKFLTKVLEKRVERLNIKFYEDFKDFFDRAEGLHNMASISNTGLTLEEKRIIGTIFRYYV